MRLAFFQRVKRVLPSVLRFISFNFCRSLSSSLHSVCFSPFRLSFRLSSSLPALSFYHPFAVFHPFPHFFNIFPLLRSEFNRRSTSKSPPKCSLPALYRLCFRFISPPYFSSRFIIIFVGNSFSFRLFCLQRRTIILYILKSTFFLIFNLVSIFSY